MKRCSSGAICCPRPNRRRFIAVQEYSIILCSQRHVERTATETAASSGHAAATVAAITSGGRSVILAQERLVTIMLLE